MLNVGSSHAELLNALSALRFFRYRVDFSFEEPLLVMSGQRAVLWRGALGAVFRSLVCHDMTLACDACSLEPACPYPRVFAVRIPAGEPAIARLRDPPRPFVLRDPQPEAASLPAGAPLSLGLVLVGRAVVELPYFVASIRRLGDEGIGRERSRFDVDAVRVVDAEGVPHGKVFEASSNLVRPLRRELSARELARPGDAAASRVRVRFVTPTDLRGGASSAEVPPFGRLIRRARDRVSALATFFCEPLVGIDAREVGELADSVEVEASELRSNVVSRRSARTGQRHDVGGVTGFVIYRGAALGALMPWVRLAEALGVGKHATFGNGCIALDVLA